MVPTQFVRLLRLPEEARRRYDLSSLKMVVHGSAPVAPDTKRAMIEWLGPVLYEFYGGTEGGGVSIDSPTWLEHPGSVGKPREGLGLEVRDDNGNPVPAGVEGQVWFHDGQAFEYKDDPEKTAGSVRDGWFSLGDIAYLDDDGFLYLCDRRADVDHQRRRQRVPRADRGGAARPPRRRRLLCRRRARRRVGRVGAGRRAARRPARRRGPSSRLTLLEHCRATLSGYQVPRAVDFDDALPRTETGKLARRTVRDRYWVGRERRI